MHRGHTYNELVSRKQLIDSSNNNMTIEIRKYNEKHNKDMKKIPIQRKYPRPRNAALIIKIT